MFRRQDAEDDDRGGRGLRDRELGQGQRPRLLQENGTIRSAFLSQSGGFPAENVDEVDQKSCPPVHDRLGCGVRFVVVVNVLGAVCQ